MDTRVTQEEKMVQYRWANPHEWLIYVCEEIWDRDEMVAALHRIARKCCADDIQDVFEGEMNADGYFDPL